MEESFDPIAQTRANSYTPGSPVQVVRVELLKGSISGDRAVCLTFKNISRVNLTALEIRFKCKTTGGEILCEDEFEYRDLDVKPGELFGMDDAVFITQKPISSVDVVLRNVYNGKRVVKLDNIKRVRLPAPRALPQELAAALEERMGRKGMRYAPQVLDCGWYCACGAFHPKEEDTVYCSECGSDRILLQNALNTLMQPEQDVEPEDLTPQSEPTAILPGTAAPRTAEPVRTAEPNRVAEPTRVAEPLRADEATQIVGAPAEAEGTRAFEPVQPARHEAAARVSQETRLFTQPSEPQPAVRRQEPASREEDVPQATRPVRADDRWNEQPRYARVEEEEEDEDEEDRDPVAENIIRWVPPLTALICAGIALYGFVYYQFFL